VIDVALERAGDKTIFPQLERAEIERAKRKPTETDFASGMSALRSPRFALEDWIFACRL
jgi:hypothetical protein